MPIWGLAKGGVYTGYETAIHNVSILYLYKFKFTVQFSSILSLCARHIEPQESVSSSVSRLSGPENRTDPWTQSNWLDPTTRQCVITDVCMYKDDRKMHRNRQDTADCKSTQTHSARPTDLCRKQRLEINLQYYFVFVCSSLFFFCFKNRLARLMQKRMRM